VSLAAIACKYPICFHGDDVCDVCVLEYSGRRVGVIAMGDTGAPSVIIVSRGGFCGGDDDGGACDSVVWR
jgi:hypothetical protein